MNGTQIMSFTLWRPFWRRRGPKARPKTMKTHSRMIRLELYIATGTGAAGPHPPSPIWTISASIVDVKSITNIKNIDPNTITNSDTTKLKIDARNDTPKHPSSMPKGIINQ